jgi:purine nucleosidase
MRLIIDTDTAGDDAISILLAARHPRVALEAVTICNGNVAFDQQVENALFTLEAAGKGGQVPVYRGCRRPLQRKPVDAAYVFGADGMSDSGFPKARQRPEKKHAVEAIIECVMANPGEVTILAQAPLTNIATAYQRQPRIAKATRHLWIMGGTDNAIGNTIPAAEFNFYVDPEAAKIVLNAGFRVTLSTWTLAMRSGILRPTDFSAIERMNTPLSRFFLQVNESTLAFMDDRYGGRLSAHPDSLTCAMMLDERLILEAEECAVDVETKGELTRGYSSVSSKILPDHDIADPAKPLRKANARVVKRADTAKFGRILIKALR